MTRYLLVVLLLAGCQVKEPPPPPAPKPVKLISTPPDKHGVVCYKIVTNNSTLSCVKVINRE